ncbi:MAG: hypothetical protein Q4E61_04360 [Alphaproteobacteria bacterium]|nr:hypothetical protein [Alphaproteobacteria bacterium]
MKKFLLLALLTVNFSLCAMEEDYYDSDSYGISDTSVLTQIGDILRKPGGIVDYAFSKKTVLSYPEDSEDLVKIRELIQTRGDKDSFIEQVEDHFLSFPQIDAARENNLRFKLCRELGKMLGGEHE